MKNKELLEEFHLLAEKLEIKIMKGKGDFSGGGCVVNNENVIVINNNKPIEQRLNTLAGCFKVQFRGFIYNGRAEGVYCQC